MGLEHTINSLEASSNVSIAKCGKIKSCIDSFLLKNAALSLQNVEDKTRIPITTLRRIISFRGNPNPETVIKIFLSLGFDKELVNYMEDYHPEIAMAMAARSHNQERDYIEEDDAHYFTEKSSFLIMTMAYTKFGITKDEIRSELGLTGVTKLNELLKKGLVIQRDNGRIVGKKDKYKLSYKDTLKRIENSLEYYRISEAGGVNNFLNYQTASLNEEGIRAEKILNQEQAIERRERIYNNPDFQGDIKKFNCTISSTFKVYNVDPEVLK